MEETTQSLRGGWQKEETERLWQEVVKASEEGTPLRGVFEKMGKQLGRKPNSVRNYYYMQLRARGGDSFRRSKPFETFSPEEIRSLVKSVLVAKGRGQSVRACVMELSQGDKTKMLRLQNKYRSCLQKRPELIKSVLEELRLEGVPCEAPRVESPAAAPDGPCLRLDPPFLTDPEVRSLLEMLSRILSRNARRSQAESALKAQRDLALLQMEEIRLMCRDLIGECRAYLSASPETRAEGLEDFCENLTGRLSQLESTMG